MSFEFVLNLLEFPFKEIYFLGPRLNGYGFWEGRRNESICAALTSTSESLWIHNQIECSEIVNNNYNSFKTVVVCMGLIYVYFVLVMSIPSGVYYGVKCMGNTCSKHLSGEQHVLEPQLCLTRKKI
jgi:hypothetical protein